MFSLCQRESRIDLKNVSVESFPQNTTHESVSYDLSNITETFIRQKKSVRYKDVPANFWGILAKHGTEVINATEALQDTLQSNEKFRGFDQLMRVYNEFVTKAVRVPMKVFDISNEVWKNITSPIAETRQSLVTQRDMVLDSLMRRQTVSWSPLVEKSRRLADLNKNLSFYFHDFLGDLLLKNLSKEMYDLRVALREADNKYTLKKESRLLCLLNQRCCGNPSPCLGLVSGVDKIKNTP